jgi:hypothetical protein
MRDIDPKDTTYQPLARYADRLPSSRPGRKLNRATLWRWALRGFGEGTRLKTVVLGGCRFTSDAWVAEFIRARSGLVEHVAARPPFARADSERILKRFGSTVERGDAR